MLRALRLRPARRSGSRRGRSTCRPAPGSAPPAGSGGSSSARRGASRPSAPCAGSGSPAARDRSSRSSPPPRGLCGMQHALTCVGVVAGPVPVGRPLPHVADHVVEAVAVRRKRVRPATCPRSRRRARFCHGNSPCHVLAMCRPRGANSSPHAYSTPSRPPRAANSHSASVGSSLPSHLAKRLGVAEGDVHHRMALAARRSSSAAPVGCRQSAPRMNVHQLPKLREIDAGPAASRTRATRHTACAGSAPGIVRGIRRDLGERDVAGGLDEAPEALVGDRVSIDPEPVDGDPMDRRSSG